MSRFAVLLTTALAALALAACDDSTGITAEEIACPTGSTLTYANYGQQVINDYCLSCHDTRESPRLGTQAQVQANANRIIEEAVYHSSMPEDRDMTNEQRIQLGQWLTCGAP